MPVWYQCGKKVPGVSLVCTNWSLSFIFKTYLFLTIQEGVDGANCDGCHKGFFSFNVENANGGCLQCFCMGITRECTSSTFQRNQVYSAPLFTLLYLQIFSLLQHMAYVDFSVRISSDCFVKYTFLKCYFFQVMPDFRSDFGGFSLIDYFGRNIYTTGFEINNGGRTLTYPNIGDLAQSAYYWSLPEAFLGDKVCF